MSHNTSIELEIKDIEILQKAVADAFNIPLSKVELHKIPVDITDYYGKEHRKAHVVVRKETLVGAFQRGWADAGFFVADGKAVFNHDNLDTNLPLLYGRIKGQYARHTVLDQARRQGRRVTERVENGKYVIRVQG